MTTRVPMAAPTAAVRVYECSVCLSDERTVLLCKTPCGHMICADCIILIKKYECPMCRQPFPAMEAVQKSRLLFNYKNSEKGAVLAIYDNDQFPTLGNNG